MLALPGASWGYGMTETVAGHCGPDDLGKPDRTHVGALNQAELDQSVAKREAEEEQRRRIADATNSVSAR
jgi:hypothetical protein